MSSFHCQNFTLDELIPAKINFVMNAFNNSEAIARVSLTNSVEMGSAVTRVARPGITVSDLQRN